MTLSGCCGLLQGGGWRGLSAGFRPSRAHSSWSKQARSCCRCLPRPYFHGTSARAWRAGAPGVATARIWRPGREAAGSHGGGGELGLFTTKTAFLMRRTSVIEVRHCPCGCLHPAGAVRQAESVAPWPAQAVCPLPSPHPRPAPLPSGGLECHCRGGDSVPPGRGPAGSTPSLPPSGCPAGLCLPLSWLCPWECLYVSLRKVMHWGSP